MIISLVIDDKVSIKRPWEALPRDSLDSLAPLLPSIAEEIIETLSVEVPAYAKPLEGDFGRTVRLGVEQALEQFADLIRNPGATRATGRNVYVALGRGELRSGRSIGALLAAYRVGARVAWRRLSAAGLEQGLEPVVLNRLAESIFAYIDELSAESAEGYALEQAQQAGEIDRRRGELVRMLADGVLANDVATLTHAADDAGWRVPVTLAMVVWRPEHGRRPAERLPTGTIVADLGVADETRYVCAVVADPEGPGRADELQTALGGVACGVGSTLPPSRAAQSFKHAVAALKLGESRALGGPVFANRERAALMARADLALVDAAANDRLAPLDSETALSGERLRATLLAWLRNDGNVSAAATELHVHAQTVRYRLARLRDLLGETLDDPDARFEIEVALRASV